MPELRGVKLQYLIEGSWNESCIFRAVARQCENSILKLGKDMEVVQKVTCSPTSSTLFKFQRLAIKQDAGVNGLEKQTCPNCSPVRATGTSFYRFLIFAPR